MGYTTDFVGHFDITPPLNPAECEYLGAFTHSRRWDRPGGPYVVPGNPHAEEHPDAGDRHNRPAPGQPQLWCQWVMGACADCLSWDGNEKFYAPVEWLVYLIDHFLKPGARASQVVDPQFDNFTFDHVLDGVVVGCRRDTRELFAIEVRDNVVRTHVLRPGDPEPWEVPLPYEAANDRWRTRRLCRNRNLEDEPAMEAKETVVVDLGVRRAAAART